MGNRHPLLRFPISHKSPEAALSFLHLCQKRGGTREKTHPAKVLVDGVKIHE